MINGILFALLTLAILVIGYLLATRSRPQARQTRKKQENKTKILELFQDRNGSTGSTSTSAVSSVPNGSQQASSSQGVTNNDIEKLLGITYRLK